VKRYTLLFIAVVVVLVVTGVAAAQTPVSAKPEENARLKPLVAAETKFREALNAKIATLPEAKAVNDAKEAYNKALEALNKAAENLPENAAWREAGAKVLDEAYRIQAAHNLSSREFKPELNSAGDLVFSKMVPPKQ